MGGIDAPGHRRGDGRGALVLDLQVARALRAVVDLDRRARDDGHQPDHAAGDQQRHGARMAGRSQRQPGPSRDRGGSRPGRGEEPGFPGLGSGRDLLPRLAVMPACSRGSDAVPCARAGRGAGFPQHGPGVAVVACHALDLDGRRLPRPCGTGRQTGPQNPARARGLAPSSPSKPRMPAITSEKVWPLHPWSPRMANTEAAGRPPRIAPQPARTGRSRPPASATHEANAQPGPVRPGLRDSEVDELERELTDDDLRSANPAEQARVENAKRRLGDRALLAELAVADFTGPVFEVAVTEFAAYGIAVLMAWMRTGQIIDKVLKPGKWDPRRGASLKTFFVGACLLQFPNVFEAWLTEQRKWAQVNDEEPILDDAVGGADPQWADPTGDTAVRTCTAMECLSGIPDPQTRQAAWLVFGQARRQPRRGRSG